MEKHRNNFFLYFLLSGLVLAISLLLLSSFKAANEVSAPSLVSADVPKPLPQEEPKKDEVVDILSPDGKTTLRMKNGKETGGTILQSFYIITENNNDPEIIFTKVSPSDNLISVPYNTFSPNDKYILLKYEKSGEVKYLVLSTDGKEIQENSKPVEITELFYKAFPEFIITDVTGWGGYTVIVVNTDTKDGKTGPSWWLDMTNLSFIRLSTRFN